MSLATGTKLGPYEILAPLGAGGMGEVYRARDTKLKREVAIKVLPAALAHDPERLARFEREAKVLASLNQPNIAQIHSVEEANGVRALVMELVPGAPLHAPLSLDTALNYARQIADALEAAHDKGIIHRDLKPANIMVTPEGVVKVLDFGLAAVAQPGSSATSPENSPTMTMAANQTGVIMGTAAYMSPEQAAGKPVDKRADIWSFGVVLWEMLVGERLFDGETISHTLADVLRAPIDFTKLLTSTPAPILELLKRCLDRDLKTRLQAIGEARIAIQKYLAAPSGSALIPSNVNTRSTKWPWAVATILAVALASASGIAYHATRPVDRPLMRLIVDLGPDTVSTGGIPVAISPDGTRLVYPIKSKDGKQQLATRLLDQTAATVLPGTDDGRDPFFSPDGQWVGFFAESKLKKISVAGGAPVTLCDAPNGRGASWGQDGNIIAALNMVNTGLSRVSAGGGTPQRVSTAVGPGGLTHRWPQVLPGDSSVLFTGSIATANFQYATVEVLSVRTGERKILVKDAYFGRYFSDGTNGYLGYIHDGALFVVTFDVVNLKVRGTPVPMLEQLGDPSSGAGLFDFSQTGTFVYRNGKVLDRAWQVDWLESQGSERPGKLSSLIPMPAAYSTPRFSPDGRRLALSVAVERGGDVFVHDLRRDATTRLTFGTSTNQLGQSLYPIWAPDGKHIAFRGGSGSGIDWLRADGSGTSRRLLEAQYPVIPYSFSPNGQILAYAEQNPETGWDMWTLKLDLTDPDHPSAAKPEPLLHTPAQELRPYFSADGRWIAYESDESGRREIYVRSFSKAGGRWQISSSGGTTPMWSPTSRELYYEAPDNRIMVANYAVDDESFRADKPRLWSSTQIRDIGIGTSLDIHPDGKRFVIFPRAETNEVGGSSTHLTFLLNFFDEVRRKVPVGK